MLGSPLPRNLVVMSYACGQAGATTLAMLHRDLPSTRVIRCDGGPRRPS